MLQSISDQIQRSKKILLVTHRKPDGDAIGSVLGLTSALEKLGKEVVAMCADAVPETFAFLPATSKVKKEITPSGDFVITLDCSDTEVEKLKYRLEGEKLHIVVTPKAGVFEARHVSFGASGSVFDLIIATDVADEEQLGGVLENHRELFFQVPVICIDHHATNTHFGQTNWVDPTASSASEMVLTLIRFLEKKEQKELLDADIATYLFAGVTTDTGSFQHSNTSPRALEAAADLLDAGARQQEIIKHVFRTKKLTTLKLWGLILSRIETDERHRMAWSTVTQRDALATGAEIDEAGPIIDELMLNAPGKDVILLFKEDKEYISVSFRSTTPQADVGAIALHFGGGGHTQASGAKIKGKGLAEVMTEVLAYVMQHQGERLGLPSPPSNKRSSDVVPQILAGGNEVMEAVLTENKEVVLPSPVSPPPQQAGVLDPPKPTSTMTSPPVPVGTLTPAQLVPTIPPAPPGSFRPQYPPFPPTFPPQQGWYPPPVGGQPYGGHPAAAGPQGPWGPPPPPFPPR